MASPYIGEIRIVGFNFAPRGWAFCDGQIMSIAQNTALFSILGITYGGNGQSTYALPDFRGRAPVHQGQGPGLSLISLGQSGGVENVTLSQTQMPGHSHSPACNSGQGDQNSPNGAVWATPHISRQSLPVYATALGTSPVTMQAAVTPTGGGQPHNNLPPYLTMNFIIAQTGVFPPRS